MHASVELVDIVADVLARIRARGPRVHCITNTVAQQYTANMLLAAGAVRSMTIAPWVLDPVFIDSSPGRVQYARRLLVRRPSAVRLNAAEFAPLRVCAALAVETDAWRAAVAALAALAVAGEVAGQTARGPGSFAGAIIDAVCGLDRATLRAHARVS